MTSPYRPEQASGMTGSSVAHGHAGGVILPEAVKGFDVHFDQPHSVRGGGPKAFPAPTHSYAGGAVGAHVKHNPRI